MKKKKLKRGKDEQKEIKQNNERKNEKQGRMKYFLQSLIPTFVGEQ